MENKEFDLDEFLKNVPEGNSFGVEKAETAVASPEKSVAKSRKSSEKRRAERKSAPAETSQKMHSFYMNTEEYKDFVALKYLLFTKGEFVDFPSNKEFMLYLVKRVSSEYK